MSFSFNAVVWPDLINFKTRSRNCVFAARYLANWHVVGTGDFNADGLADIVWRENSGAVAVWEMSGNTAVNGIGLPNPGLAWSIADVNDYNADGYSDLLWRNPSNGDVALWLLHENTVLAGIGVPNPTNAWAPVAHDFDFV